MTLVNWIPTLAMTALFLSSLVTFSNPISAYVHAMLAFVTTSSIAALASIFAGTSVVIPVLLTLSMAALLASILHARSMVVLVSFRNLAYTALFVTVVVASQVLSRIFGLSSIGFTDGHEVLLFAEALQLGEESPLSGVRALKRGFGLPAMEALGFEGEYFVGLIPLFFLGAILATIWLVSELTENRSQLVAVSIVFILLTISTESVTRHVYLINTHSLAWMLTAVLLVYMRRQTLGALSRQDVTGLIVAFASIGFLRMDYIFLFGAFTLFFVLTNGSGRSALAIGVVFAQGLTAAAWTSIAVDEFPFLGAVGPVVLLAVGGSGTFLLVGGLRRLKQQGPNFTRNWLYVLAALFALTNLLTLDIASGIRALAFNLFAGEGLWGYSAVAIIVLVGVSYLTPSTLDRNLLGQVLAVGLLTIVLYLFAKYLDGVQLGAGRPSFARIGWGDSLNRTLVTWLPFLVFPLTRLVGIMESKGTSKASRPVVKKR